MELCLECGKSLIQVGCSGSPPTLEASLAWSPCMPCTPHTQAEGVIQGGYGRGG